MQACLTARARVVAGQTERHRLMSAPQVQWYRDQGFTIEDLALGAPLNANTTTGSSIASQLSRYYNGGLWK